MLSFIAYHLITLIKFLEISEIDFCGFVVETKLQVVTTIAQFFYLFAPVILLGFMAIPK